MTSKVQATTWPDRTRNDVGWDSDDCPGDSTPSRRSGGGRQGQLEGATSGLELVAEIASHQPGELAGHGEAETDGIGLPGGRTNALIRLQDRLPVLERNTLAIVGNRQVHRPIDEPGRHLDLSTSVTKGVGHEIADDL